MDHASRRQFVGIVTSATLASACSVLSTRGAAHAEKDDDDTPPVEDLMREHGVLRRILGVYDEAIHRIDGNTELPLPAVNRAAALVKRFVEDYHEKMEEDLLFPRFEKASRETDLVATLRRQHDAGRVLTLRILGGTSGSLDADGKKKLRASMHDFRRMYRPHAAREDTVLFPAAHHLLSKKELERLGEEFEKMEHRLMGGDGFELGIAEITAIEKLIGIDDLAAFTPAV